MTARWITVRNDGRFAEVRRLIASGLTDTQVAAISGVIFSPTWRAWRLGLKVSPGLSIALTHDRGLAAMLDTRPYSLRAAKRATSAAYALALNNGQPTSPQGIDSRAKTKPGTA